MRLLLLMLVAGIALSYGAAAAQTEKLTAADLQLYRSAFAAAEKDRWGEARRLAAQGHNPLPAKVIQWMDLARPGPGRSFEEYRLFLKQNPHWPWQITLLAQAERAMPGTLPVDQVLQWFGDREPLTIQGTMQLARALLSRRLEKQAVALIRRGWTELNVDREDEKIFLARYRRYLRDRDHVARLDRLLWEEEEDAARRMMPRVDKGHQALAEARLRLMSMDPGVDGAIRRVPRQLLQDPGLIYDRARWRRRKGMYEEAIEILDPPPVNVSQPEIMWPEKEDAARRALSRGDVSIAYRLASSHETTEGLSFAEGEWLAGWIALRFLDDRKIAYEHFTRMFAGVSTSISLSRAAYWAGRAAEDMGELALAQSWYDRAARNLTTYYGQLAAHRLGRTDAFRFPPLPEPTQAERTQFAKRELVRIVRLLEQLDQIDRARPFLLRLADAIETPAEGRMVADLADEADRDDLAVAIAKSLRLNGTELIEYLYPLRRIPDGNGPEKGLILAVMRQESAFAVDAVSPAGARGLMQLMPGTAKHVASQLNIAYSKDRLLDDPNYNIVLGRAYLDELVRSFRGSYVLALASYNAGPSRAVEWIREYGDPRDYGVDVVDWIESIPFGETRNYVQRVLENLQVYRHRLGDTQMALSLEQDLSRRDLQ